MRRPVASVRGLAKPERPLEAPRNRQVPDLLATLADDVVDTRVAERREQLAVERQAQLERATTRSMWAIPARAIE
jgi:hypothetical protein